MAVLSSGITAEARDNATASLPDDAESAQVARLQDELATAAYTPAFVVLDRGGDQLTEADQSLVAGLVTKLAPQAAEGQRPFPANSQNIDVRDAGREVARRMGIRGDQIRAGKPDQRRRSAQLCAEPRWCGWTADIEKSSVTL